MSDDLDISRPGPAGLYFRPERLAPAALLEDRAARSRLEHWCSQCGQRAHYAYGETLSREGVWSCSESDCRAAAEAEAAGRDQIGRAA